MRIVLAEDETLLREGLIRLLVEKGQQVVGTAGNLIELLDKTRALRPELVITDIRMPPTHTVEGLTAALTIRAELPETAIVLLSQYTDSQGALELLEGGSRAVGYLLKQRVLDVDRFMQMLDQVVAGGTVIDPEVVAAMVGRTRRNNPVDTLTPRRLEVLELMAQGHSNARIARELVVTEKAVERNIALIFDSLGLPPKPDDHRRVLAVVQYLNRDA
ncbi:MAG: response regulator transcription factor [Antricoccus sp.]